MERRKEELRFSPGGGAAAAAFPVVAAQHAVASSGLLALHPRGAVKTESLRPKSAYDGGRSNKVRKVEEKRT